MLKYIFMLLLLLSSVQASKEQLVLSIMENSGTNYDIKNFKIKLLNNDEDTLAKKFSSLYNAEEIKQKIYRKLINQMSLKELKFLNRWYKTKTSLQIKKANKTVITEQIAKKLLKADLNYFNKERVLLIAKIDKDLRYSAIDYYYMSMISDYYIKKHPNIKRDEIQLYAQDKERLRRLLRNQTVTYLYYKYQSISTKELKKYKNFLYTPETYKFLDITQNTLNIYITNILNLYIKN